MPQAFKNINPRDSNLYHSASATHRPLRSLYNKKSLDFRDPIYSKSDLVPPPPPEQSAGSCNDSQLPQNGRVYRCMNQEQGSNVIPQISIRGKPFLLHAQMIEGAVSCFPSPKFRGSIGGLVLQLEWVLHFLAPEHTLPPYQESFTLVCLIER